MDDTDCHVPPVPRSDVYSKHLKYTITLFQIIIHHSHRCIHFIYIYLSLQYFPNMFFIPQHLRISQHLTQYQHGNCRILADGTRIWHLECCHFFTSVLGRRPQPSHLGKASECVYNHFFWTPTSHTLCQLSEETLFGHFHSCIECGFYTAAIAGI